MEPEPSKCCTKCGELKPLSGFSKHSRAKDGVRSNCKVCSAAQNKAWWAALTDVQRERSRESSRLYATNNRGKLRAAAAKWKAEHVVLVKEQKRRYKERVIAESRDWYLRGQLTRGLPTNVELPQELIALKRVHLAIKRALKEITS